jgi:hypothetical protein
LKPPISQRRGQRDQHDGQRQRQAGQQHAADVVGDAFDQDIGL